MFLNKPISMAIILSIALFLFTVIFMNFNNPLIMDSLILISFFAFSLYVGFSYSKHNKKVLPKKDKVKIVSYFFIFWFLFVSSIVFLMVYLSPVKNIHSLALFDIKQIKILLNIFLMNFITFGIISVLLYWALGLGCNFGLKKSDNEKV